MAYNTNSPHLTAPILFQWTGGGRNGSNGRSAPPLVVKARNTELGHVVDPHPETVADIAGDMLNGHVCVYLSTVQVRV